MQKQSDKDTPRAGIRKRKREDEIEEGLRSPENWKRRRNKKKDEIMSEGWKKRKDDRVIKTKSCLFIVGSKKGDLAAHLRSVIMRT